MIRRTYIQRKVLDLYKNMSSISFPINPDKLLSLLKENCRILSYHQAAALNKCTIRDIIQVCNSFDGATHYSPDRKRYLILYNNFSAEGRILWTKCHEIGHICLRHFEMADLNRLAYGDYDPAHSDIESEADYFAWNLIAPLPIMREMGVRSAEDVHSIFGLSAQAATLHFDRYLKWCQGHVKNAIENDLIREFRKKYVRS